MSVTNEQLGARVDRVEGRIASVETKVDSIAADVRKTSADVADLVEAWKTAGKLLKFIHVVAKWGGPIVILASAAAALWATVWGQK